MANLFKRLIRWVISHRMSYLVNDEVSQEFVILQDVFDLPLHMARDQIEESLRNKMASIKVK